MAWLPPRTIRVGAQVALTNPYYEGLHDVPGPDRLLRAVEVRSAPPRLSVRRKYCGHSYLRSFSESEGSWASGIKRFGVWLAGNKC